MIRIILPVLLGLLTLAGPASAQYYRGYYRGRDPAATVQGWYLRYLHRDVDPSGIQTWTDALASGNSPTMVLSTILGSDEYVQYNGDTPEGFVRGLYLDIVGREPSSREYRYWLRKLQYEQYRDVAYEMLTRYPQGVDSSPPPRRSRYADDYDYGYERPYYPYRLRSNLPYRR
jgi:hypothetical protein